MCQSSERPVQEITLEARVFTKNYQADIHYTIRLPLPIKPPLIAFWVAIIKVDVATITIQGRRVVSAVK